MILKKYFCKFWKYFWNFQKCMRKVKIWKIHVRFPTFSKNSIRDLKPAQIWGPSSLWRRRNLKLKIHPKNGKKGCKSSSFIIQDSWMLSLVKRNNLNFSPNELENYHILTKNAPKVSLLGVQKMDVCVKLMPLITLIKYPKCSLRFF